MDWWASIATWTAFCEGDNCVDSAIPYTNFNDWFHFSSAVLVTTPGTPEYVEPLSTNRSDNDDNWTPDFLWPCAFDDPSECCWDYGPPTTAASASGRRAFAEIDQPSKRALHPGPLMLKGEISPAKLKVKLAGDANNTFGRAQHQPPNVPPPVYVLGQPLQLHLNGTDKYTPPSPRSLSSRKIDSEFRALSALAAVTSLNLTERNTELVERAITPDACTGPTDIPTTLPTLTYYCNLQPNICENIRSHPDWTGNSMTLTYDPFSASTGRRRSGVCTDAVKAAFQQAGKCDLKQHNPAYWKVSGICKYE